MHKNRAAIFVVQTPPKRVRLSHISRELPIGAIDLDRCVILIKLNLKRGYGLPPFNHLAVVLHEVECPILFNLEMQLVILAVI